MDSRSPRSVIETVYQAMRVGDTATLDELLDPGFEATFSPGLPLGLGGVHESPREAMARGWRAISRAFDVVAEPECWFTDDLGTVLVTGTYRGAVRSSGQLVEAAFAHTWTLRDARVAKLVQLTDSGAWREALDARPPMAIDSPEEGEAVRVEIRDGIANVRLARPVTHNRFGPSMAEDLAAAIRRCDTTRGVRCVLVSADGEDFTVGGDLTHFATHFNDLSDALDVLIGPYHAALAQLGTLPVPVVCAAQGAAAGGGLGLLWAADVVIVADDLKLVTGFPKLGLSGDGGSSWALPRLVGLRKALQLSFDSPIIGAAEAVALGLVDRMVPAADLQTTAQAEAERLAAGPTVAYGHLRRLLRQAEATSWSDQLTAERIAIVDCGGTRDAVEGIRSFHRRRPPKFEGRS